MALNPKLNVYVVTLNPKVKDKNPTFRDFLKLNIWLMLKQPTTICWIVFSGFLDNVGKSDYRKDAESKKVIGVSEYNAENQSCSLNLLKDSEVVEGIIDGGQYGVMRAYADVDNKNDKTTLGTNKAVLDKFYICLCTPLNSAYGFLYSVIY